MNNPLSEILDRVFNEASLFNKDQWADILNVSAEEIDSWVSGIAIPRPLLLRSICRIVKDSKIIEIADELARVLDLPILQSIGSEGKIRPRYMNFGSQKLRTLQQYMVTPFLIAFLDNLSALPPDQQEKVLYEAVRLCSEKQ